MKIGKMKKKIVFLIIVAAFIIMMSFITRIYIQNRVIATVNGKQIRNKDITNIRKQLDEDGDYYYQILDDIIDEYVAVLNADKVNVKVTPKEVEKCIQDYKENFPDVFEKGSKLYGEKDFYDGIELQLIYDKVYKAVVSEKMEVSQKELEVEFLRIMKEKNKYIEEMSEEEFFQEYETEFTDFVFDIWIADMKKEMDIYILK